MLSTRYKSIYHGLALQLYDQLNKVLGVLILIAFTSIEDSEVNR